MGDDATRALAVASMLLAARNNDNDGTFNGDPEYIKRFAYLNSKPNFKPLLDNGFIELVQDASTVLATCNTEKSREETEIDISSLKLNPKKRKTTKTTISDSFTISEAVKIWADANGHSRLIERLAHFSNACKAKGYEYADWDAAFRNAISDDWAKLGKQTSLSQAKPTYRAKTQAEMDAEKEQHRVVMEERKRKILAMPIEPNPWEVNHVKT